MRIKTGFKCALLVAFLSPTCKSNDTRVATEFRAKAATGFISFHVRQPNIEQNDLGFEVLCHKES
jgi:hypothetical protein